MMNLNKHVEPRVLTALLNNELSGATLSGVRRHVSSCQICRDLRAELLVDQGFSRLMQFDDPDISSGSHISERDFQAFWRGETKDQGRLSQISAHCFACGDCREKRQRIWLNAKAEAARLTVTVGMLAAQAKRRRPWIRGMVMAGVVLAFPLVMFLARRETGTNNNPVASSPGTTHNAIVEPVPATSPSTVQGNQDNSATAVTRQDSPRTLKHNTEGLIAQAQVVNLRNAPILNVVRGASEEDGSDNPPLTIVPCRDRGTRLRIELPENNLIGRYVILIQEPASLQTIATAHAASNDGRAFSVSVDLRDIPVSDYVMSVSREDKVNGSDYIGSFDIRLVSVVDGQKQITK